MVLLVTGVGSLVGVATLGTTTDNVDVVGTAIVVATLAVVKNAQLKAPLVAAACTEQ